MGGTIFDAFLVEFFAKLSLQNILIAVLASGLASTLAYLLVKAYGWTKRTFGPLWGAHLRLQKALNAVSDTAPGMWLSQPTPSFRADYQRRLARSNPIITTVANLKGGVGKTTLAANLGARYAVAGEKVLLIDLDFQGSLSSMMMPARERRPAPGMLSKASRFVGEKNRMRIGDPVKIYLPLAPTAYLCAVPAFYDLVRTENRIMIEWLLGSHESDARYWLAETLLSDDYQTFDRVIIDAPPRLMTASVQALCASNHVIIPTILDGLCVEAVDTFLVQLREHQQLWRMPLQASIVPTMTSSNVDQVAERDALKQLQDIVSKHGSMCMVVPKIAFIRSDQLLSRAAGKRIAYSEDRRDKAHQELRQNFHNLATALERMSAEDITNEGSRFRPTA
jgi:chromosome partitioning protein